MTQPKMNLTQVWVGSSLHIKGARVKFGVTRPTSEKMGRIRLEFGSTNPSKVSYVFISILSFARVLSNYINSCSISKIDEIRITFSGPLCKFLLDNVFKNIL